jgi:hypothetical protein
VKVANSRGPKTIDAEALTTGATAVEVSTVVQDVQVLITSFPLNVMPVVKPLVANLSAALIIIDTSNYYRPVAGSQKLSATTPGETSNDRRLRLLVDDLGRYGLLKDAFSDQPSTVDLLVAILIDDLGPGTEPILEQVLDY